MFKQISHCSSITFLILCFLISTPSSHAQTLKVQKSKGKKAIVEVIEGGPLMKGQIIQASGDSSAPANNGSRGHFIGLQGSMAMVKSSTTSKTTTTATTDFLYGWNQGTMEYGILGQLTLISGSGSDTTTIGAGGKFDYNFTEHKAGVSSLFSVGVEGVYATASGSGSSGSNAISIFPMVSWRTFALGTPTCIRVDVGMNSVQTTTNGTSKTTTSQTDPMMKFGLFTYF